MSFPQSLEAALEGTLRRSLPATEDQAETAPEVRLLRAAAFEGVRLLAGRLPSNVELPERGEICPDETQGEASPAAVQRLLQLFGERRDLVPEWFELARARGVRLPPAVLPDVLDLVREQPRLHDALRAVGGQRLAWLAARNSAWRFVVPAVVEPKATLAETWSTDSAATRLATLARLAEDLSSEDEPLLERALHDRRKDVRQAALRVVRRLPESRFAHRWAERARGIVEVRNGRLEVHEPREVDPTWMEDGLEPRAPRATGAIAWTLAQVVAFAPPSVWPRGMLALVLASDWAEPLIKGLSQAAIAYRDAEWAEELLRAWVHAAARDQLWAIEPDRLLEVLPPARAEHVLRQVLDEAPRVTAGLVARRQVAWSADFSRFVVANLARFLERWEFAATAPIGTAALQLDPSLLPEAIASVDEITKPTWVLSTLQSLITTLRLRQLMRVEM